MAWQYIRPRWIWRGIRTQGLLVTGFSLLLFLGCQTSSSLKKSVDFGSSAALGSDSPVYQGRLTETEREAGLINLWAELKHSFVYLDLNPDIDWDKTLEEYLPQAHTLTSDWNYYLLLMKLAALLNNGQTLVIPPPYLLQQKAILPLKLTYLRDKVVVLDSLEAKAELKSIVPGTMLLAIDGISMADLMATYRPYVSASTFHARQLALLRFISLGEAHSWAMVRLQAPDGTVYLQRIQRTFPPFGNLNRGKPMEAKVIEKHIAYVAIRSFQQANIVPSFEAFFVHLKLADIQGFILDLRENAGGDSKVGYAILSHFFTRPAQGSRSVARLDIPVIRGYIHFMPSFDTNLIRITGKNVFGDPIEISADHSGFMWMALPPVIIDPESPVYSGPLAVLMDHRTANAAEDAIVVLDASKRATLIGQTTAGSTGQPLLVPLPGGGKGLVCAKKDTYPDGTEFVGIGIRPNLSVEPTLQDMAQGQDPIFDRAMTWLQSKRTLTDKEIRDTKGK